MAAESNNTAQRTCPSCPPLNPLALFTHTLHLITPSTFLASFLNPLLINSHPHIPPSLSRSSVLPRRWYFSAAATVLLLRPGT